MWLTCNETISHHPLDSDLLLRCEGIDAILAAPDKRRIQRYFCSRERVGLDLQAMELAGAVPDEIYGSTHPVQHRHEKVAHGRLFGETQMSACRDGASP